MNKFWGKMISLVCFIFLFAWTVFADQQSTNDLEASQQALRFIMQAMEQTGAEPERIQLHYGTAYRSYDSVQEIEQWADRLGSRMSLEKSTNSTPHEYTFLHTNQEGVQTELRVIAMPKNGHLDGESDATAGKWDSYITVRLNARAKDLNPIQTELKNVYKALADLKILPQFNSCVQGIYNGTLKIDVQRMKVDQLFTIMGATVVEKVEDSTVRSYSGFSPSMAPLILTNGKKMNVQVGLHTDQREKVTRLTIGTPIITMEY
ncbi:MAG TPA: YwmB family TATA-box binding protein [Bacillota bacterium]|nr:YwmB family TATA-box binding protein [Bacillota bacterium]